MVPRLAYRAAEMTPHSEPIPFSAAAEQILSLADEHARARPVVIVGVTGPVASGKSSLARLVSPCIVATDDYLPNYDETPEGIRDLPESSDLPRLAADLAELRAGRPARVPVWSFHSHRREGERVVEPMPFIVCEGLHALHESLDKVIDVRVYVDAPREARWTRALAREQTGERGWPIEFFRHFFENVAEPTYHARAAGYRLSAHVLVENHMERG